MDLKTEKYLKKHRNHGTLEDFYAEYNTMKAVIIGSYYQYTCFNDTDEALLMPDAFKNGKQVPSPSIFSRDMFLPPDPLKYK